ncbi:MAG: hypothetical protein Q4D71_12135 [Oscillospiraceae bacterium]|jgi:hypothetical protein|nr:hypothetical protein [Oscillospiraceae bacterium]
MTEYIRLNKKQYPIRVLWLNEYEMYAMISSEELNDALIEDSGEYVSEMAKAIDERIFFFVPAALIHNGSEDEIERFIKHHSGL